MAIAAFFDMDETLLRVNSGTRWLRFLRERDELKLSLLLRSALWTLEYKLAILDIDTVARRMIAEVKGTEEAALRDKCQLFFERHLRPAVSPLALTQLARHRAQGHCVVVLTSATSYVAEPVARHLSIDHVLCTRLDVEAGRFLGTVRERPCYGTAKVTAAERFADAHGIDLAQSYFYTDSFSDLPMLLRVGQRRVVNPDTRLKRYARRHGWSIEAW